MIKFVEYELVNLNGEIDFWYLANGTFIVDPTYEEEFKKINKIINSIK